jgi:hypothetical protein
LFRKKCPFKAKTNKLVYLDDFVISYQVVQR